MNWPRIGHTVLPVLASALVFAGAHGDEAETIGQHLGLTGPVARALSVLAGALGLYLARSPVFAGQAGKGDA